MATAESFVRRLTRRLTEDPEQRDVEELTDEAAGTGAQRAIDCQRGQEVTMVGTLRSVETAGKGGAGGVRAELFDGSDTVTYWLRRCRRGDNRDSTNQPNRPVQRPATGHCSRWQWCTSTTTRRP